MTTASQPPPWQSPAAPPPQDPARDESRANWNVVANVFTILTLVAYVFLLPFIGLSVFGNDPCGSDHCQGFDEAWLLAFRTFLIATPICAVGGRIAMHFAQAKWIRILTIMLIPLGFVVGAALWWHAMSLIDV
jgi:hypothetical protein